MPAFFLRYLLYAALGFGLTALPAYHDSFAPAACRALALAGGWLALRPADVVGIYLQTAPDNIYIEIAPECLGTDVLITFLAAVLAFPAAWRARVGGVAAGLGLILIVNPLRIASLYRLALISPVWSKWVHDWLWDAAFFGVEVGVFLLWMAWARRANSGLPDARAEPCA